MESSRGKGNFGGRVRDCTRRRPRPTGLTGRSNTVVQRRVESGLEIRDWYPNLQLILDRFQEGFTKVTDTERVEGATMEGQ